MSSNLLVEIFDQCVIRLSQGDTIDTCVQSYPQYANDLRVMLETTRLPRRAMASDEEIALSQDRVAIRFEQELSRLTTTPIIQRSYSLQKVASIILAILFIGSLLTGGVVVAAQDSLPGDTLYGVKRASERIQVAFSSDPETLEQQLAQRRIDETKRVIELGREVEVQFTGVIGAVTNDIIMIDGLLIEPDPSIRTNWSHGWYAN